MLIIVQRIETTWTKRSRGMPGAKARNSVPKAFNIPVFNSTTEGLFIHEIRADESHNFELHQQSWYETDLMKYWSLHFREESSLLRVFFTYDYYRHGQPKRNAHRQPIMKLDREAFACFCINGRFTSYSGQFYRQHFVNLAYVKSPTSNIFLSRRKTITVNKMADLF